MTNDTPGVGCSFDNDCIYTVDYSLGNGFDHFAYSL